MHLFGQFLIVPSDQARVAAFDGRPGEESHHKSAYRSFYRSVTLPSAINTEKAQATYRNGVLELHIPRAEGAQPRHIKLQQTETGQLDAKNRAEGSVSEKSKK